MRNEEHLHQVAVFRWAAYQTGKYPGLGLMFAVPNGGARHIAVARKLKAEGVKAGVPDIFLPVPHGTYHGLFIEMKSTKGKTVETQDLWLDRLAHQGYKVAVCRGAEEAIHIIQAYMEVGL